MNFDFLSILYAVLILGAIAVFVQQSLCAHNETGNAVTALLSVVAKDSFLNRMQLIAISNAFDGNNIATFVPVR